MSGERLRDFVDVAALSEKLTLNQMRQAYEGRFNTSSSEVPRALAFHGDIDFNMKPEMQGYRWSAIATRLEQMQRSPDRLFPPHCGTTAGDAGSGAATESQQTKSPRAEAARAETVTAEREK
jgi:hypothetical protein